MNQETTNRVSWVGRNKALLRFTRNPVSFQPVMEKKPGVLQTPGFWHF